MASYQIIQERQRPSFLGGLGAGLAQGGSDFTKVLLPAILKQQADQAKAEQQAKDKSAAEEALEQGGFEIDTATIGADGKRSNKFKRKTTAKDRFLKDPAQNIKEAILGIQDPVDVANQAGLPKFEPLNETIAQNQFPLSVLTGKSKDITNTGATFENASIEALRKNFAGGATNDQIGRDFLGLLQAATQQSEIPTDFTAAIQGLKTSSGGSVEEFVAGIEDLKLQYVDNPEVLKRIKLILQTLQQ